MYLLLEQKSEYLFRGVPLLAPSIKCPEKNRKNIFAPDPQFLFYKRTKNDQVIEV
jgi:hypothetical protein